MSDPYFEDHLSQVLNTSYERLRTDFPRVFGLGGAATEFDLKEGVSRFFQRHYDAFVKLLPKAERDHFREAKRSESTEFVEAVRWVFEPDGSAPPRANREDLCNNLCDKLSYMKSKMDDAITRHPKLATAAETNDLRKAAVSVGLGAIAHAVNVNSEAPLRETAAELSLRHAASIVHDFVGDPPPSARLGDQDTAENYLDQVTRYLLLVASVRTAGSSESTSINLVKEIARQTMDLQAAREEGRFDAYFELVRLADITVEQTERDALNKDPKRGRTPASDGPALCAVFAEAMRGVLGMQHPGRGKFDSASGLPQAELEEFGRKKLLELRDASEQARRSDVEDTDEENETPRKKEKKKKEKSSARR